MSVFDLKGGWNRRLYRHAAPRDPRMRAFAERRQFIERGRLRVAPSEGWEAIDRHVSSIWKRPCRDLVAADATPWLSSAFRDFFERRIEGQGSEVFVTCWTGWPRAGLADAALPGTRFIHVVRDGRAVANSWLQMRWWDGFEGPGRWFLGELPPPLQQEWEASDRSFVVLAGLGWRLLMDAYEAARAALAPEQWLQVRYEDLLEDPKLGFERMLAFLELEWSPEFDEGFRRYRFDDARTDAFRLDLDQANLGLLERAIGPTLARFGYEPMGTP